MNCPACRTTVPPATRYCIACGANLAQQSGAATVRMPALIEPPASPSTTIMVLPAPKSKGTALAIEAIASIFGIFGAGWFYSGNTLPGILLLIAGICWDLFALFAMFFSLGFGVFCLVPIHMVFVLGTVLLLALAVPKTA